MIVLTLGVIGGTGYFVLHKPGGVQDPGVSPKLLRNLSDRDPDVSQDAAIAIRAMGPKAIPTLEEAVRSTNPLLSERAQKLLAELKPVPVTIPTVIEAALPEKVELQEFVLESRGGQARAADLGALWVQFRNGGPAPVIVGYGFVLDHPGMAAFEVENEKGEHREVPAEILINRSVRDLPQEVTVHPHRAEALFQGGRALVLAVSKPGTYKIRFAYDATEGSDYRKVVRPSPEGVLLPPARLVSNSVTVTVTE